MVVCVTIRAVGTGTRLEMHEGRLVVVKHAAGGPAATRLDHEAACLRRAEHPGVVELVDLTEGRDDGSAVVRTAFVGGGTLADRPPGGLGLDRMVQVAASVAATLADLHHRGITHGRVSADHVLVSDGGGAVLCGLAEAAVGSSPDIHRSAAADDVAAVGALIRELASDGVAGADGLHAVSVRALAGDPSGRPSMRSVAEALDELVGKGDARPGSIPAGMGEARSGSMPAGPAAAPEPQGRCLLPRQAAAPRLLSRARRGRARLLVVGTVAGLAMAVAVSAVVASGSGSGPGSAPGRLPEMAAPQIDGASETTVVPPTTAAITPDRAAPPPEDAPPREDIVRVWPPSSCEVPGAEMVADVDGDGCDEEIKVDGGVVQAGDRRWEMAGPQDVVLVGDWDCEDIDTPTVLRPGSGQVWRFPRWANEGEEVAAVLVATVPGAVDATVEPTSEGAAGCHQLSVLDIDGATTRIDPSLTADRP